MEDEQKKKEEKRDDSYSFLDLDIVVDGILHAVSKVKESLPSAQKGEEILENISETLSSGAEKIGDHAGDLLEGAGKVAGEVIEKTLDIAGDIIGNIE
ncbi:MAG TPA: hypothetical protein DIT04_06535 [Dysgonomonas sp.]|nr:hypothetical protein [Dysgonomonas sp.]